MRKKLALLLATVMLAGCLTACGDETTSEPTSEATPEVTSEVTSEDTVEIIEDDTNDALGEVEGETNDIPSGDMSIGTVSGNVYTDENAGVQIAVPDGWAFVTDAAQMSQLTGESEEDIQALWNGEVSPLDQELSYVAIAYNETTGTNIIVSYHNIEKAGYDEPLDVDTYIEMASSGMDGTTGTLEAGGKTWSSFEVEQDEEYEQMMLVDTAEGNDMVMVLLTFTVMSGQDESMDSIVSYIQPIE